MPEGHTIHRLADDHQREFAGQRLLVSSPQGRFATGAQKLHGRELKAVEAHGKHLFYRWERHTLHVHLGLYGKFRRLTLPATDPKGQVRLRIIGTESGFDLNGPNACELLSASEVKALLSRLGADPLRSDSDPEHAWNRISRSRSSIGGLLMDQSVIAGVGNIYRAEILYLLGIHPACPGSSISRNEFQKIWDLAVALMTVGKRYNRIITRDPKEIGKSRTNLSREERLWIYKRDVCPRCNSMVQSWKISSRTVYACPRCQPVREK
ncbi:MAG: Fpg/Nei family DNA glycosylase [Planctomycetota bacterium]